MDGPPGLPPRQRRHRTASDQRSSWIFSRMRRTSSRRRSSSASWFLIARSRFSRRPFSLQVPAKSLKPNPFPLGRLVLGLQVCGRGPNLLLFANEGLALLLERPLNQRFDRCFLARDTLPFGLKVLPDRLRLGSLARDPSDLVLQLFLPLVERLRPCLELRGRRLEMAFALLEVFVAPRGLFHFDPLGLEASVLFLDPFLQFAALLVRRFLRILEEAHRFRFQIRSLLFPRLN